MKTFIVFVFALVTLTSCDVYVQEEQPYHRDDRDDVVGRYELDEYSETYRDYTYYTITINKGYERREVYIQNFYGLDNDVFAYVDGSRITIPFQVVDGYEIEGHGQIVYDDIDLHYSVTDRYDNSPTDFCSTLGGQVYH